MKSLNRQLLRFLLFSGIGLIHGIVPAIAPYSSVNATDEMRLNAAIFSLCGSIALALGWSFYQRAQVRVVYALPTPSQILSQPHLRKKLTYLFTISALIGAMSWPCHILSLGATFTEYAEESRFAFRGSGNALVVWFLSGLMNLALLPGFLGFFLSRRHRMIGIAYALTFACIFYLVSSGTRSFPIGLIGSVLSGYVLHRAQSATRLVSMGCGVGAIVFLTVGLLPLRWRMADMSTTEMVEVLISAETYEDMLVRDPLNYHEYLVEVMSYFPTYHDFVHGASYRRILFFYLPHSMFPELKPKDPNRIVAQVLFDTDLDVDWMHPPSIFGDAYINFSGWYGLIHLVLLGVFFAWISKVSLQHLICLMVFAPNLVYFTFIGIRGQPYTLALNTLCMAVYVGALMFKLKLPLLGHQTKSRQGAIRRTRRVRNSPQVSHVASGSSRKRPLAGEYKTKVALAPTSLDNPQRAH